MTTTAAPTSIAHRQNRRVARMRGYALSASLIALALAAPAAAQVAGSGSVVSGSATISPPTAGAPANTTQVVATTAQTVINWTPSDTAAGATPIDFLPSANNWNFYGPGDYVIFNRIIPTGSAVGRAVGINGNVNSFVGTPIAGVPAPRGGSVWFYSPDGIAIGATSAFDVGSLVLTTNDILTTGGLFGTNGEIRFRGTSGSTAAVNIASGASINAAQADPGGSYIAVVSPRIAQAGNVRADGSTAYVAAEQVDITTNNGLFDISVLVGTEGGFAIQHTGTTGGPSHADGDTDQNRIYMVAVPKAAAIAMLVSGQVGYDDAAVAAVDANGAVRLSAGFDVAGGEMVTTPVNATRASIGLTDVIFNSQVTANASFGLIAQPTGTISDGTITTFLPPPQIGRVLFRGGATLVGDSLAVVQAGNQQQIGVVGDLVVRTRGSQNGSDSAQVNLIYNPAAPGLVPTMVVTGTLAVSASATGITGSENATGGTARVNVDGGFLQATTIGVIADGRGIGSPTASGSGTGGVAEINVNGATGQLIAINGLAFARGIGAPLTTAGSTGGSATGGTAQLSVTGGAAAIFQAGININADGLGGTGRAQGGAGTGGIARVTLTGTASSLTTGSTLLSARGVGGGFSAIIPGSTTETGGDGTGGTAEIISEGQLNAGGTALTAEGLGGSANSASARGGAGTGGTAQIVLTTAGSSAAFSDPLINADGVGGGAIPGPGFTGTAGSANGGTARLSATTVNANITGNALLSARADAQIGGASIAGPLTGGTIEISAASRGGIVVSGDLNADASTNLSPVVGVTVTEAAANQGGTITVSSDLFSLVQANSMSMFADGFSPNSTGATGTASGGSILLQATNRGFIGTNGTGFNIFSASAIGGSGPVGGAGIGGDVTFDAGDGSGIGLDGVAFASAGGTSGASLTGSPGAPGVGGFVTVRTSAGGIGPGSFNFDQLFLSANGQSGLIIEGAVGPAPTAGSGFGGFILIDNQGGNISGNRLDALAGGFGGSTNNGAGGADGFGGTIDLSVPSGTLDVGTVNLAATGSGGISTGGGAAGSGFGGLVTVNLTGGQIDAVTFDVGADGVGSAGLDGFDGVPIGLPSQAAGNGGTGIGGTVNVIVNGSTANLIGLDIHANGTGGAGGDFDGTVGTPGAPGNGGVGVGGAATLDVRTNTLSSDGMTVAALGQGGNGGTVRMSPGTPGATVGGIGGDGFGGQANAEISSAFTPIGLLNVDASGLGGIGGTAHSGGRGGSGFGGVAQSIAVGVDLGNADIFAFASGLGGGGGTGLNGDGGSGGDGLGGIARAVATGAGGRIVVTSENIDSVGSGGVGGDAFVDPNLPPPLTGFAGGNGGSGFGGTNELRAVDGATVVLSSPPSAPVAPFASAGVGGNGGAGANNDSAPGLIGGNGGNAGLGTGGTVLLNAIGGTVTTGSGNVQLDAQGFAGFGGASGTGSTGTGATGADGLGTGGQVTLRTVDTAAGSGRITLNNVTANVSGDFAGRFEINNGAAGTGITLNTLDVQATGIIANGAAPSAGGAGAFLRSSIGDAVINGNATITTDGSVEFGGVNSGTTAVGGILTVNAGGQIILTSTGGAPNDPTLAVTGGASLIAGGNIVGSPTSIVNAAAINLQSLTGSISAGTLRATGGDATVVASGTVNIANIFAGDDIRLSGSGLTLGTIDTRNPAAGVDNESDGRNIVITSPGVVTVVHAEAANDLTASTGSFATGLNSIITGGDIDISASGGVDLGNSTAGGFIRVVSGGTAYNNLAAGSTITLTSTPGINPASGIPTTGAITGVNASAPGAIAISGTSVTLAPTGTTTSTGGSVAITATTGNLSAGAITAAADVTIISAGTTLLGGAAQAGDDIRITSAGLIDVSALTATGLGPDNEGTGADIVLTGSVASTAPGGLNATSTGDFAATGPISAVSANVQAGQTIQIGALTTTGATSLSAAGALTAGAISSGGTTALNSTNGAITVAGLASTGNVSATGDSIAISGGSGALQFTALTADVGAASVSSSGNITVFNSTVATTATLTTGAGGNIDVGAMTAQTINLNSGANIALGSPTATLAFNATAAGTINVLGILTAPQISLASSDIAIGTNGRIGGPTTTSLAMTNNDASRATFIGGAGTTAGYSLSAAEMTRIFGTNITITAPRISGIGSASVGSGTSPSLIIDDFTFIGGGAASGGQIGPNGGLTLSTTGKARVIGDVRMTNMTDTNFLALTGIEALEIIQGQGSVDLRNNAGGLGGILRLRSNDVIAATLPAISDVGALLASDDVKGVTGRLALNDGIVDPLGTLRARGIVANIDNGLYIQNSGATTRFDDRRGFTFGAGGFIINGFTPGYNVVINGVNIDAAGLTVTGARVIPLLSFPVNPATGAIVQYDLLSTANGCLIANPASCAEKFPGTEVQDVIDGPVDPEDGVNSGDNFFLTTLISLRDLDPLAGEPLLDDPVTGAGNDDLWTAPDGNDEDEEEEGKKAEEKAD